MVDIDFVIHSRMISVQMRACGWVKACVCQAFLLLSSIVAFRKSEKRMEKISKNVNWSIQRTGRSEKPLELFSLNPIFRLYLISYAAKSLKQKFSCKVDLNFKYLWKYIWWNSVPFFYCWNKWLCSKEDVNKKNVCASCKDQNVNVHIVDIDIVDVKAVDSLSYEHVERWNCCE